MSPSERTADGLIVKRSSHSVAETLNRLEEAVKGKGLTVFNRIDHAAGAVKAGQELPPTQLLIFGNPQLGTPLMQAARTLAIDLPLKAIAWQDEDGVWLSYNDPAWLVARHGAEVPEVVTKMSGALDALSTHATSA